MQLHEKRAYRIKHLYCLFLTPPVYPSLLISLFLILFSTLSLSLTLASLSPYLSFYISVSLYLSFDLPPSLPIYHCISVFLFISVSHSLSCFILFLPHIFSLPLFYRASTSYLIFPLTTSSSSPSSPSFHVLPRLSSVSLPHS